ncbi:Ribonuclease 3-like protein 1 [Capsicum baccatum]|uniref:Ribonuclease 3-like protein 1 n=1 Tax=Capsicum baccatum TaxID=33114 RepID=A0A2G2WQJ7_CAPBA|nr:Ribonuclease 3-like protein 1 [Capsicum baccatum]
MEHCEAEKILQRLRGEYRRNTVEKKLDKSGEDEEDESDTAQLIVRRNVTGPDPNPVPPLRFDEVDMDGNSKGKGTQNQGSTRSRLYEICAVNHWKAPLFECCKEEGPDHHKLFTFKVIVEMRGPRTATIECMGNPHSKKKAAAENAAEGALWFLNQAGYTLNK